ncbi:MAG: isochorismatase family protein [Dehalococcoidales bacterium]|nr:isochorismatase family protein [Dehalococcoidales bacterium]
MEITVNARPEPVKIETDRTALVVVDMQNAFCSRGGLFDILGKFNENRVRPVTGRLKKVIAAARKAGLKIIYLRMGYRPDLADTGGPQSPNFWKEGSLETGRRQPQLEITGLVEGTRDWQIIDELKPCEGDIVVNKNRFSGFPHTQLDIILKTYNLKYLLFGGLFTNVCVESTLRDAYFHEYFPLLISDCCGNMGPDYTQEATIWVVANVFGWVTETSEVLEAMSQVITAFD